MGLIGDVGIADLTINIHFLYRAPVVTEYQEVTGYDPALGQRLVYLKVPRAKGVWG